MSTDKRGLMGRRAYDKAIPVALFAYCAMLIALWVVNLYWLSLVSQRYERMGLQIGRFEQFLRSIGAPDQIEPEKIRRTN